MALRLFPDCFQLWNQPGKALCVLSFPATAVWRTEKVPWQPWLPGLQGLCNTVLQSKEGTKYLKKRGCWAVTPHGRRLHPLGTGLKVSRDFEGERREQSQGGWGLVPLDMWTAPWGRFLSHRWNPTDRFTLKSWVLPSAAGAERNGHIVPVAESKEGRLWRFPRRCLDRQTLPSSRLAGDVVQLWDVRKCQVT